MGRPKRYGSEAEKQAAYRQRQKNLSLLEVEAQRVISKEFNRGVTFACPEGYDAKMWAYACERAERARQYALRMPEHVRPSEVRFQSPEWQYEDQIRYPLPSGKMLT